MKSTGSLIAALLILAVVVACSLAPWLIGGYIAAHFIAKFW